MSPLLLVLCLLVPRPTPDDDPPRTLRVGPGEAFATVQAAVQAARSGDTVRVAAGVHRGPIRIDRPLLLLGGLAADPGDHGTNPGKPGDSREPDEPRPTLDGARDGTVVTVASDSVEVRGFTIRSSGRSLDRDEAAIRLERCTDCRIVDNRIEDSLHGIYLLETTRTVVTDNAIVGDTTLDEARRGNGIHLFHSPANRIERNRIRGTRDGIYFSFADGNDVVRNRVTGVRYGLHYMYSNDNRFTGNEFRRNAAGAALMFSDRIVFRDNVFAEHVGHRAYGILLQTSTRITAEGNRFTGNLVALYLDNALHNRFTGNVFAANGVGIELLTSAEANTFAGNAFTANRVPVRSARGGGMNAWSEAGRGNWWDDPSVFDLDGDGVGDRPFRAGDPYASLAQRRPVLELFAGTLAARALAWAERAFPVFGLPTVEDPAPLARPPVGLIDARLEVER